MGSVLSHFVVVSEAGDCLSACGQFFPASLYAKSPAQGGRRGLDVADAELFKRIRPQLQCSACLRKVLADGR